MPEVLIYSDPHLGLVRKANFTTASSDAREAAARKVLHDLLKTPHDYSICGGDLFDKANNPESVVLEGLRAIESTDLVVAGNHDLENREGHVSSLSLLDRVVDDKVVMYPTYRQVGNTTFRIVPHARTQEQFLMWLDGAKHDAVGSETWQVLVLHCNYNYPDAFLNETALNLTEEMAADLLGVFHYILIGHHHTAADFFDRRLRLIGSTFPTAFDNLDDKRALIYDTENGLFREVSLWRAEEHLLRGPASAAVGLAGDLGPLQFFDLEDDLPPSEVQKLAVSLFKAGALGVRVTGGATVDLAVDGEPVRNLERLPQTIEGDLRTHLPHLLPLWTELLKQSPDGA